MPTMAWNGTLVQESYYTAANAMLQLVANDSDSDGDERAMLWSRAAVCGRAAAGRRTAIAAAAAIRSTFSRL